MLLAAGRELHALASRWHDFQGLRPEEFAVRRVGFVFPRKARQGVPVDKEAALQKIEADHGGCGVLLGHGGVENVGAAARRSRPLRRRQVVRPKPPESLVETLIILRNNLILDDLLCPVHDPSPSV